ncbi:MAG TPA: AmmeMemoRadiSam system protein B [Acidimicrobiales bacterium]|nr:AmmeMemoRadiSam system protein B [Acidimicrobiales bacterium]
MNATRAGEPAVAGTFYPSDPDALRTMVEYHLRQASAGGPPSPASPPKALVAPHAGYVYSGPVAASAYARVVPLRGRIERVVLLGPAHRVPLTAIAAPAADALVTPLGPVPVDTGPRDRLVASGSVVVSDQAHAGEHSLEVHLPFVQVALGDVSVLPLLVGRVPASTVADVLDAVWGGEETVVVVSTDLSHYHDHATATELDRRTADAILGARFEELEPQDACGVFPLRGLLALARRRHLDVELVDLRTSGDTSGDVDRVVGYGAFALSS